MAHLCDIVFERVFRYNSQKAKLGCTAEPFGPLRIDYVWDWMAFLQQALPGGCPRYRERKYKE